MWPGISEETIYAIARGLRNAGREGFLNRAVGIAKANFKLRLKATEQAAQAVSEASAPAVMPEGGGGSTATIKIHIKVAEELEKINLGGLAGLENYVDGELVDALATAAAALTAKGPCVALVWSV